ncbi:hypothetical protein BS78_05G086500 [Paspalum vaginatum]|nr:hypothetical protein BS78_05G086500 [Paspalum vaginatum]
MQLQYPFLISAAVTPSHRAAARSLAPCSLSSISSLHPPFPGRGVQQQIGALASIFLILKLSQPCSSPWRSSSIALSLQLQDALPSCLFFLPLVWTSSSRPTLSPLFSKSNS